MSQERFRARGSETWKQLETLLGRLESRRSDIEGAERFPADYRRLAQHLALARHRQYSADLVDRLNRMAMRAYRQLHGRRVRSSEGLRALIAWGFPRAVRADARLFWVASLLFYGPWVLCTLLVLQDPEFVYSVLDPGSVAQMEEMYDPSADHIGEDRGADSDLLMFGFYIRNNVGIAFRTFAGGAVFGVGALFILVFNGLHLGAVMGHLTGIGYGSTFYPFIASHGPFELTAIVLAGMVGLKLGLALLAPGRLSRGRALKESAQQGLPVVYGFTGMLFIAAFIEAFWSSSVWIPAQVKLGTGALLWVLVLGYLALAGRSRGP